MRSQAACTNTVRRHIQALAPSPRPLAATCPVIHKRACCVLTRFHEKLKAFITKRHTINFNACLILFHQIPSSAAAIPCLELKRQGKWSLSH